jgi:DNA-binding response OmpR family regulator
MAYILVVEDDVAISAIISKNLCCVGHKCDIAFDGDTAINLADKNQYDLIVLDIMLPVKNGYEVLNNVSKATAVICLTARDSLTDKITCLNLGADDYIVKPFEALELITRINAVLRRIKKADNAFTKNDITVDMAQRTVCGKNGIIDTTPQEFKLLEILIINRNIALSREKLLELAWGYDFAGDTRTVDSHIQRLRMKLGFSDVIKTVYKLGYRLED